MLSKLWTPASVPKDRETPDGSAHQSQSHAGRLNWLASHRQSTTSTTSTAQFFQEALKFVPTNAIVVEIDPQSLLQVALRQSLTPTVTLVSLMKKVEGVNVDAVKLLVPYGCDHTIYPVPYTTGFISDLVKWDHQQQWTVPSYKNFTLNTTVGDEFTGHQLDGRIINPPTGNLHLVWKTFAKMNGYPVIEKFPVGFESTEIHRFGRPRSKSNHDSKERKFFQPTIVERVNFDDDYHLVDNYEKENG